MSAVRFEITLELLAPFLFKSGAALPLGLDAATLTNNQGAAIIPGSHIRGHLLHAWQEFAALGALKAQWIAKWLGAESEDGKNDQPNRGRLDFDGSWQAAPKSGLGVLGKGLWLSMPAASAKQSADVPIRFRVRIDDESGVADPGALQLIGQTHASGNKVQFVGCILADSITESEKRELQVWIERALQWIPALGALKGIGFGQLNSFSVKSSPIATKSLTIEPADQGARRCFSFTLDRPFCFGARVIAGNRFESVPFVPGGALRGALFGWCERAQHAGGTLANDAREILKAAGRIHIRHSWACKTEKRLPAVIPQSAIAIDDSFVDASDSRYCAPFLYKSKDSLVTIPAFVTDWKTQRNEFNKLHEFLIPDGLVEVRTAIDQKTGSAYKEKLFSLDCRVTADEKGSHQFRSEIILLADNHQVLWQSLARVLPLALNHLGKTEARAENLTWAPTTQSTDLPDGDRLVLTLLSDALLSQFPLVQSGRIDGATLPDYKTHFELLTGGALQLLDLYADQRLVGGHYFKNRYWNREAHYRARVLTLAGSVFVFKIVDREKAGSYVSEWLRSGLPSADGDNWENNPYLPANGFGEVCIGTGIKQSVIAADKIIPIKLENAEELSQ